jgi:hypothetical protein
MREAKSVEVVQFLHAAGAKIRAYDPAAMDNAKRLLPAGVTFSDSPYEAAEGAPAAVLVTEWTEFKYRKLARLRTGGRVAAPPFALRKLEAQAKRYTAMRLRACLGALHDADERLKGRGELPAELALERLVLTLSGEPRAERGAG